MTFDLSPGTALLDSAPRTEAAGVAARLAGQAVRYAATLATDEHEALAVRLYCYGRLPVTSRWSRRFPGHAAVAEHLGVARGARGAALDRRWALSGDPAAADGWLSWARRDPPAEAPGGPTIKLYLSPRPEALREAFGALVEALDGTDALGFKVGRDAHGLLRPDKLVAYFPSLRGMHDAAGVLAARLSGVPAQGVPFTAALAPDALLSWGADPVAPPQGPRESWRLWVARRLAAAIVRARRQDGPGGTAERALALLHHEHGVSPETWEPPAAWLPCAASDWS